MDENTKDFLVAAVTVTGAFVTGVVVAAIGFWQAHRLEQETGRREDDRLRDSIAREDARLREAEKQRERERWSSEKRVIYARFVHALEDIEDLVNDVEKIPEPRNAL